MFKGVKEAKRTLIWSYSSSSSALNLKSSSGNFRGRAKPLLLVSATAHWTKSSSAISAPRLDDDKNGEEEEEEEEEGGADDDDDSKGGTRGDEAIDDFAAGLPARAFSRALVLRPIEASKLCLPAPAAPAAAAALVVGSTRADGWALLLPPLDDDDDEDDEEDPNLAMELMARNSEMNKMVTSASVTTPRSMKSNALNTSRALAPSSADAASNAVAPSAAAVVFAFAPEASTAAATADFFEVIGSAVPASAIMPLMSKSALMLVLRLLPVSLRSGRGFKSRQIRFAHFKAALGSKKRSPERKSAETTEGSAANGIWCRL